MTRERSSLVGLSNVTAEQLEQARAVVRITSVQNRREPGPPDVVLDRCEDLGIAFLTYTHRWEVVP